MCQWPCRHRQDTPPGQCGELKACMCDLVLYGCSTRYGLRLWHRFPCCRILIQKTRMAIHHCTGRASMAIKRSVILYFSAENPGPQTPQWHLCVCRQSCSMGHTWGTQLHRSISALIVIYNRIPLSLLTTSNHSILMLAGIWSSCKEDCWLRMYSPLPFAGGPRAFGKGSNCNCTEQVRT